MVAFRTPPLPAPTQLLGSWRRMGDFGPLYVIHDIGETLVDGDVLLQIEVLGTEERLQLPWSIVIRHPEAD